MGGRCFVVVSISEGKRRKGHVVYDGEGVFRIDDLGKLPDAVEVYLDASLPRIFDETILMGRQSIRPQETDVLRIVRQGNGLKKSDDDDAVGRGIVNG